MAEERVQRRLAAVMAADVVGYSRLSEADEAGTRARLTGTTTIAISKMLPDAVVSSATLEFGTFGPIKVLRAMQAENWFHHKGNANGIEAAQIKSRMKQVYYPETDDWKRRVWEQSKSVATQAIKGIAAR